MAVAWEVRPASAGDSAALALVGASTFLETFAGVLDGPAIVAHCQANHSAAYYDRALTSGGSAWLVTAAHGAAPVGFALLGTPDLPGMRSDDVELKRIYLLSRFHGCGAGHGLFLQVLERAQTLGSRLLLGVYAGNVRAIAFYTKQGFQKIAERQFDVGGTLYNDVVFARSLR